MHLRDHSIGKMMAQLIALLAEEPGLEVHVFVLGLSGGRGGHAGGEGTEKRRGGDPIVEFLQSRVHHWHQV